MRPGLSCHSPADTESAAAATRRGVLPLRKGIKLLKFRFVAKEEEPSTRVLLKGIVVRRDEDEDEGTGVTLTMNH